MIDETIASVEAIAKACGAMYTTLPGRRTSDATRFMKTHTNQTRIRLVGKRVVSRCGPVANKCVRVIAEKIDNVNCAFGRQGRRENILGRSKRSDVLDPRFTVYSAWIPTPYSGTRFHTWRVRPETERSATFGWKRSNGRRVTSPFLPVEKKTTENPTSNELKSEYRKTTLLEPRFTGESKWKCKK